MQHGNGGPVRGRRNGTRANPLVLSLFAAVVLAIAASAVLLAAQPKFLSASRRTAPGHALKVADHHGVAVVAATRRVGKAPPPTPAPRAAPLRALSTRAAPLRALSTWPHNGALGVPPLQPIEVVFSSALAVAPAPLLNPPIAGSWEKVSPTELEFKPTAPPLPLTTEHLVIPGGPGGPRSRDGATLPSSVSIKWQVANGSVLRIQQILAQLGFLPVQFSQTGPLPAGPTPEVAALFHPPHGNFHWRYPDIPASLQRAWVPGAANIMTRGAIVAFERANKMVAYTTVRPGLWPVLLAAEQAGTLNPKGYSYAMVSEDQPESLAIWHNGTIVYRSAANTGLPSDPTPVGTFFVYLRYRSQTMQGYNPNGSYYIDHGVRWVNYFDGSDAIHGFIRSSYGFPQSLGCVELPVGNAAVAWTWLHYGTLVTVSPPVPAGR